MTADGLEMHKKNAHERQPMLVHSPPKDSGNLVYLIVLLNGIGVLLPWNMFITIAPQYYVDYWFTQNGTKTDYALNFMGSLGIVSQFPNVAMNFLNIVLVIGGGILLRIVGPLIINCINVFVVIVLIIVVSPSVEAMGWFYALTLGIVAIINMANGLYQNSIYGLFADFPPNYTNGIVLGNNVCGTFTTVLSIVITMLCDDVSTIALIYFSISLAVLIACLISMLTLKKLEFFKYYTEKGNAARVADNDSKPKIKMCLETFKKGWVQFYNVFFTFFITLTLFPAVLVSVEVVRDETGAWPSVWPESIYISVTTFLNFNLFATIGSFLAGFYQWPKPGTLWVAVTLRVLFVPFFLYCNYLPGLRTGPVIFQSEWWFFFGVALMALTSGYFSSLGMMYAPRVVPESLSNIAGMTAAFFLIVGIFAGVSFSFVCQFLVERL